MRLRVAMAVVAVVLFSSASATWAQAPGGRGPGGGGFSGGFGVSRMSLLRNEAVQKELELLDDQIAAITKLQQELGGDRGGFGGRPGQGRPGQGGTGGRPQGGRPGQGTPGGQPGQRPGGDRGQRPSGDRGQRPAPTEGAALDSADGFQFVQQPNQPQRGNTQNLTDEERQAQAEQRRKEAAERAQQEKEKLADVLLPHQMKRLNEIYIQALGSGALQDAEVAKELGISDEQKKQIEDVRTANSESMREQFQQLFQGGGAGGAAGDREQVTAKLAELRKTNDEKVLAVLTAAQKQKFEQLKGKPFEIPAGGFRGGFGAPGGGAPGGRPAGGAPGQGGQGGQGRPQRPTNPDA
jgi:Spy/CpxP family protein refolding chaperone